MDAIVWNWLLKLSVASRKKKEEKTANHLRTANGCHWIFFLEKGARSASLAMIDGCRGLRPRTRCERLLY